VRQRHQHFPYATVRELDVLRAAFADHRAQLHRWFERRYGGRAFGYNSGRAALRALLRAADMKPGDEVIVCGFTCLAVPEAVLYAGATPVYADMSLQDWSSGVEQVLAVATERTRAVVVQHTFGIPASVAAVVAIARQRGWFVIEDCALALGSEDHGTPLGSMGDAAIFSFEMTKTVTAGWGGMAVVRNAQLAAAISARYAEEPGIGVLALLREILQVLLSTTLLRPLLFGATRYLVAALYRSHLFRMSGRPLARVAPDRWSYRLPRFHASLVYLQLARLERIRSRAAQIAARYRRWLDDGGHADVSGPRADGVHLLRFPLLVDDPQGLCAWASRHGFELGRWFDAPVAPMPDRPLEINYSWGQCPQAEKTARRVVNLPLHLRMTDADVERLIAVLDSYRAERLPLPDAA
jgi:perosamine synthetase